MRKRGKILRDTTSGPGLVMIEGQQYHFSLEGVWRSQTPPQPGQIVEVAFDSEGKLLSLSVVPESELRRQSAHTVTAPPSQSGWSAPGAVNMLAAAGLLLAAWFFLTALTIQSPFAGRLEFTFWEILGFLNAGFREALDGRAIPNAGLFGWVAMVALVGPFLPRFWKNRRALLGGFLPLLFTVIVGIVVRSDLGNTLLGASGAHPRALSLGLGTYVSIVICVYFALISAHGLLFTNALARERMDSPRRKAA